MDGLTDKANAFWFVGFVAEGVVVVCCGVVAVVIFAGRIHRSKSCILLVNRSIADLLVGAVSLRFGFQYNSIDSYLSEELHQVCRPVQDAIRIFIWYFVIDTSLTSLCFISLERACAVFKPFRHRVLKTRTYYYFILLMWSICSLQCLPMIISRCQSFRDILISVFSLGSLLGCLVIIVVSCTSICIKLGFFPDIQVDCRSRGQIELCGALFCASVASMVTVLPSAVEQIVSNAQSLKRTKISNLYEVTMLLLFSNSFVNFFVYAWRFPEFSGDMKTLFRWRRPIVSAIEVEGRPEPISEQ